jgi:hypothetical protein
MAATDGLVEAANYVYEEGANDDVTRRGAEP